MEYIFIEEIVSFGLNYNIISRPVKRFTSSFVQFDFPEIF